MGRVATHSRRDVDREDGDAALVHAEDAGLHQAFRVAGEAAAEQAVHDQGDILEHGKVQGRAHAVDGEIRFRDLQLQFFRFLCNFYIFELF